MSDSIHIHKVYGGESELPLTKKEREYLHKSFNYDNYVKAFARWAAFYGFLIGAGVAPVLVYLFMLRDGIVLELGALVAIGFSIGLALGGVCGQVAVWYRGGEYRELAAEYRLDEFAPPVAAVPADVGTRQAKLNDEPYVLERQDKTVSYSGHMFTFSGKQLDAMLDWMQKGASKIRRDGNAEGPGLASIGITSANYSRAHMVLKGRGLIDENSEWTARGVAWLEAE